jgi:[acyl-carrier-protein] S-malonyltransferase
MSSILGLPLDKVEEIARGVGCEIANLNCPDQVVISGEKFKVELAQDLCKNAGAKRCIMLKVSGAFHSRLMVNAKAKLKTVLDNMKISEPVVDFISNMDAEVTRDTARIRQNLANQLDSRTLWERSVRNAVSMGYKDFIEVGPGSVLKGLLRKIDTGINVTALHTSEEITAFAQSLKA